MSFHSLINTALKVGGQHSPEILLGLAVVGVGVAVYRGIKDSRKADKRIEKAKEKKAEELGTSPEDVNLSVKEKVIAAAPAYISTGLTIVAVVGCIVCAQSINAKRNAAMMFMYTAANEAAKEFEDKTVEVAGERVVEKVKDEIMQDHITNNPPPADPTKIYVTGRGDNLCYDSLIGRYFYSSIERVRKAVNDINARLTGGKEEYVSLNDFYYELGLPAVDIGNQFGWNIVDDGTLEVDFGSMLTPEGVPCFTMQFCIFPRYSYWTHC